MFVKDALEEEVGIMVELCGAVWRKFQPKDIEMFQSKCYSQWAERDKQKTLLQKNK